MGEADVAFTHSFGVMICGYVFQGGHIYDGLPWLLSIPLALCVLPSIILSGIPDYDADKAAGKKTIAVTLGKKSAATLAILFTLLAASTALFFKQSGMVGTAYGNIIYIVAPHAIFLSMIIYRYLKDPSPSQRIDTMMAISLLYILWFALVPLIKLA